MIGCTTKVSANDQARFEIPAGTILSVCKNEMRSQADKVVHPSILCDEVGCEELASWMIEYWLEDQIVISYACDCHVGENCNPEGTNLVNAVR